MATLRLFASAREAAGTARDTIAAPTVAAVLDEACRRYGDVFARVLATSAVWVNGEQADRADVVDDGDEVAVLPPVSGGAVELATDATPTTSAAAKAAGARPGVDAGARVEAPSAHEPGPRLAVVHDIEGPKVRMALLWCAITFPLVFVGRPALALWLGLQAAAAALKLARAARRRDWGDAEPRLAAAAALVVVLAATGGPGPFTAAVALALAAILAWRVLRPGPGAVAACSMTLLAALVPASAAASLVLVRGFGATEAVVLLVMLAAYDAGDFIVGSGAANRWEGPVAGIVAVVPVTLVVAATVVNPFRGASPFVLGAVVAATAPMGPPLASALLGGARVHAPAVRRLDSLFVCGPVWAYAAAGLLA